MTKRLRPEPQDSAPEGLCPVNPLLTLISGRWSLYVMWLLHSEGPQRYGALQRLVPGVSAKMLTDRLRMLEGAGIVARDVVATRPPQVTYSLTARGSELKAALDALHDVAVHWNAAGWTPQDGFASRPMAAE